MNVRKITMTLLAAMLVIILIGCSNKDAEDAERISILEEKLDTLFNEEKTDLAKNVDPKQFDEIDELLEAEEGNEFNEENTLRIESVILELSEAISMYALQEQVLKLVSEDGVVDEESYLEAKEQVVEFKEKEVFYERQLAELEKIKELYEQQLAQQVHVEKTEKALAKLFDEDKKVKDKVTQKDYDKVAKLIKGIEDEDVKGKLNKDLKKVDKKFKAIAKTEKEAEAKRQAEAQAQQQSSQSSNANQSTKSNTQTAGKGSGNNNQSKPKQQSKPKEQPKKEQPKKEREIVRFPNNNIGNSGKEFATPEEAEAWANKVYQDPNSKWYEYGWSMYGVVYGYYDESGRGIPTKTTYTIRFY